MPSKSQFDPDPSWFPTLLAPTLNSSEEDKAKRRALTLQLRGDFQRLVESEVKKAIRGRVSDEGEAIRGAFDRFAATLTDAITARINELTTERDKLIAYIAELERPDRPVETKERTTLLTIIAALLRDVRIDWKKPSKAATVIVGMTERLGVALAPRTIEEHLKKIDKALDRRGKR